MMIKRVDLFIPPLDRHRMLRYFTTRLHEAFIRLGVNSRMLESERLNPLPFLKQMFDDPPDCSVSLNGLLPDAEGRFFCDLLHIPHIAFLVASPHHFFSLTRTPYNIVVCTDYLYAQIFKSMGHKHTLFLPHGIEPNQPPLPDVALAYDLLFVDGEINWEEIEHGWKKKYPQKVYEALIGCVNETIAHKELSSIQALTSQLQEKVGQVNLWEHEEFNFSVMLDEVEEYLERKNTFALAQALKEFSCHVIGGKHLQAQWKHCLGDISHVTFIEKNDLPSILEAMHRSKIVLNGSPAIKNGTNNDLFMAMTSGAVVATSYNHYLQEHFKAGSELLFYYQDQLAALKEHIGSLLAQEDKRKAMAVAGRNTVMHHHTWDHRAATLLKEAAPMVAHITQNGTP